MTPSMITNFSHLCLNDYMITKLIYICCLCHFVTILIVVVYAIMVVIYPIPYHFHDYNHG
jgi:hypothetical protein